MTSADRARGDVGGRWLRQLDDTTMAAQALCGMVDGNRERRLAVTASQVCVRGHVPLQLPPCSGLRLPSAIEQAVSFTRGGNGPQLVRPPRIEHGTCLAPLNRRSHIRSAAVAGVVRAAQKHWGGRARFQRLCRRAPLARRRHALLAVRGHAVVCCRFLDARFVRKAARAARLASELSVRRASTVSQYHRALHKSAERSLPPCVRTHVHPLCVLCPSARTPHSISVRKR